MRNYVRITKLSNVGGRGDYISNPERQENIVAVSAPIDWKPYQEFERNNQKSTEPNNEGREIMLALPNEWADRSPEWLQRQCSEIAHSLVGKETDLQWAVHWNSKENNLHMHIVFSERTKEDRGVYDRDIYHTADGKVARRKADRAKDENGNIKPPVHRKGESQGAFSIKDTRYKAKDWHSTVKAKAWRELANRGADMKPKNLLYEYHEGKGKEAPAIREKNVLIRKANTALNEYLAEKGGTVASLSPARAEKLKAQMLELIRAGKVPKIKREQPVQPPKVISQPTSKQVSRPTPQPPQQFGSMTNARSAINAERQATPPRKRSFDEVLAEAQKRADAHNAARAQQSPAWNTEHMKTLHKRKKWADLTPDERQAVRKLSVNASAFENRQDFLDMKRHFKAGLDRGAR